MPKANCARKSRATGFGGQPQGSVTVIIAVLATERTAGGIRGRVVFLYLHQEIAGERAYMADVPEHTAAFLTVKRTAAYLGISENTLYVWRHRREGPPSFRMSGRVMYRVSVLDEWIAQQEAADSRSNPELNPLSYEPQLRRTA